MLIAVAGIVLAIVFSFRAYEVAKNLPNKKQLAEQLYIATILIIIAAVLSVIGIILGFTTLGGSVTGSNKLGWQSVLLVILAGIVAICYIIAFVYLWLAYINSRDVQSINTELLIAAIAITVAFLSPMIGRGGFSSVPLLGETINVSAQVYPEVNINRNISRPTISSLSSLRPSM